MPNTEHEQPDPIVEILRLAYRRGLALRREQSKSETSAAADAELTEDSKAANQQAPDDKPTKEQHG